MAAKKVAKQVTVIARVQFKCDDRKVVYLVRASNGTDQYETTMFDGKATGCTCPSKKPCYHMKGVEALESKRREVASQFAAKSAPAWTMNLVNTGKLVAPTKTEKPVKVAKTEKVESTTVTANESKDLGSKGSLNGMQKSTDMPAWLAILPSRQKALAS